VRQQQCKRKALLFSRQQWLDERATSRYSVFLAWYNSGRIVPSFTYLGYLINANNDNSAEIKKRILVANKSFYGLKRQFRFQFLSIKK
jgi:hypothetical protein